MPIWEKYEFSVIFNKYYLKQITFEMYAGLTYFRHWVHSLISFCAECLYAFPQTGQANPLFLC